MYQNLKHPLLPQTISHLRSLTGLEYDPDVLRNLTYPKQDNQVFLEFNQVRSHSSLLQQHDVKPAC